jgi:hypothetical protein
MTPRGDDLRTTAAQCLALARTTTDPQARVALLHMAQKLYDLAESGPGGNFEAVVREFDDGQMSDTKPQVGGGARDATAAANSAGEGRIERVAVSSLVTGNRKCPMVGDHGQN